MTWGAALLAFVKALPQLIALVRSALDYAEAEKQRGLGYDQAVADALSIAAKEIDGAAAARAQAAAEHDAHPADDAGFDGDFRRRG